MVKIKTNVEFEKGGVNGAQKLESRNLLNFSQKIIFVCLLVFIFGLGFGTKAGAATYYVSTQNNGSNCTSWSDTCATPSAAMAKTGNGNTIYIAPGSYSDGLVAAYNTKFNGLTLIGTTAHGNTTSATMAQLKAGTGPTINATSGNHGINVGQNNVTISNLKITGTDSTHDLITLGATTGFTGSNLYLLNSGRWSIYGNNAATFNISKSFLAGASGSAGLRFDGTSSGVLSNNIITNSLTTKMGTTGFVNNSTGTIYLYNNYITGSNGSALSQAGSGTTTAENNILAPGFVPLSYAAQRTSGTLNLSNNILIRSFSLVSSGISAASGTLNINLNNITTQQPKFVSHQREGFIIPTVDDTNNISYAADLEDLLQARRLKGSFLVFPSVAFNAYQNDLQAMLNRGTMSFVIHSFSHSTLTTTGGIYSITKAGATINIDRTNNQIVVNPGGTITGFKSKTLTAISTELQSLGASVGARAAGINDTYGEIMADSSGPQASPYTPQILIDTSDNSGFFKTEMLDAKNFLEANLTGFTAKLFGTPGGNTNSNVQTAIKNAGLIGNRNLFDGTSNGQSDLTSLDVYKQAGATPSQYLVGATDDETRRNTIALAEAVAQNGIILWIYGHNTSDCSMHNWEIILDTLTQYSEITITDGDTAIDTIKNSGTWSTADNATYTRTWTDQSDYRLQSTSSAIDAGTNVGLTTDYAGNPIYGLPDIGGYEYQPTHTMVASADDPQIGENIRVYGNGKFRNTVDDSVSNSADTAKLSIVPQSSTTTKWLDLNISTWDNSGAYHKHWTENGDNMDHTTQTSHTVGDLAAGKEYTLTIDTASPSGKITSSDCTQAGVCTADGTGKITFTYTGGYSDHTFDITDNIAPVFSGISPASSSTVSNDDTITFTDSETTNPQCSLDNSHWNNCTTTVTSFHDLTGWSSINEGDTFTLYLKDTDTAGNTGTAQVDNLTKADESAPVRDNGSPSGTLSSGTTFIAVSLTTSESATCKYSTSSGTVYADMADSLDTTNGTTHTKSISGLTDGNSYNYYVRCKDESNNANDTDYRISFSVASLNTISNNSGGDAGLTHIMPKTLSSTGGKLDFNINKSATTTDSLSLSITMNADPTTVKYYAISLDSTFKSQKLIPYASSTVFILPGNAGNYTLYLRYYSSTGDMSDLISHSILFKPTYQERNAEKNQIKNQVKHRFARNLYYGIDGEDVKQLQIYLNNNGFALAQRGLGSPGNETTFFGKLAKLALTKFQKAKKIKPALGFFGPTTRDYIEKKW